MRSPLLKNKDIPAVSYIALRKIGNFIGILKTEDVIEFLIECGITIKGINKSGESSEIIYRVLKTLALSTQDQDRQLLEKILLESVNPILYKKTGITMNDILQKYNDWLKNDEMEIVIFENKPHLLDPTIMQLYIFKEGELEKDFTSSIKNDVKQRIAEIRHAYSTLIRIVVAYSQNSTYSEIDINDSYTKLFKFIADDIEYTLTNIENIFGENYREGVTAIEYFYMVEKQSHMEGNYVQPYIYKDELGINILYKPFLNLYSAQTDIEKAGVTWEFIIKKMNICYSILDDRFHRFNANTITDYPHKKYIEQVEKTLANKNLKTVDKKGSLKLYLKSGNIIFIAPSGKTYKGKLKRGSNSYLLLQYLMVHPIDVPIPYLELANHLNKKHDNIDSDDERRVRDAVQYVRKVLKLENNDDLFLTDLGFGLKCNSHLESTE